MLGAFFMIHLLSQFLDQSQDRVLKGAVDEWHRSRSNPESLVKYATSPTLAPGRVGGHLGG